MYTGTLIKDLMTIVERVERRAEQRPIVDGWTVDEMELRKIFGMHLPLAQDERVYAGAA